VLIYTNDSNASEHVLNEIDKAFNYGKVIIPFIADDTRMSDEFDYYLSRKHWLTAFPNPEQHFAKLVESIARTLKLDTTPVVTPPPTPTPPPETTGPATTTPPPAVPRPTITPVDVPHPLAGRNRTRGKQNYDNGDSYEGELFDNKRDGQGTYTWKDGDKYVGDFIDNQRTGKGTFYWVDGERYEGEFLNGNRHGRGIYFFKNGNRYEGDFREGKRTGRGTFQWADGDRFEGDFIDGDRTGKGSYYWTSGSTTNGRTSSTRQAVRQGYTTYGTDGAVYVDDSPTDKRPTVQGVVLLQDGDRLRRHLRTEGQAHRPRYVHSRETYEADSNTTNDDGRGVLLLGRTATSLRRVVTYEGKVADGTGTVLLQETERTYARSSTTNDATDER